VSLGCREKDLKKLRFENGDIIPNVESYFIRCYECLLLYNINYNITSKNDKKV
jgi:hypothetical protein